MGSDKILITGATGFIGRHLCGALGNTGVSLRVLSRDRQRAAAILGSTIEVVEGDLVDAGILGKAVDGVDCVLHLAAETKSSALMRSTNVEGTANLINALKKTGVKKLVHLSSAGVVGQGGNFHIDENTPCFPGAEYERTKLEAEEIVRNFSVSGGVATSILRPTIVFGEGKDDRNDSFYQLLRQIRKKRFFLLNEGRGIANYVYVKDVVNALKYFSQDTKPGCHAYFLNDETTMKMIWIHAAESLGISAQPVTLPYAPVMLASRVISSLMPSFPLTPSRVKAMDSPYHYSSERIRQELGFKFEFGIKEGMRRTVKWLDERGWLI